MKKDREPSGKELVNDKSNFEEFYTIKSDQLKNCSPRFVNDMILELGMTNAGFANKDNETLGELGKNTQASIEAMDPQDAMQLMLSAQMVAIHKAQQNIVAYANNSTTPQYRLLFLNLANKLSGTFIQQINTMQKLKGNHQQKVVIEHVSITNGQTVLGTINNTPVPGGYKK